MSKLPFNRRDVLDLVLLVQDQFLRDVEQRLERIEICVPVGYQIKIVIFSKMYRCFHRCWHESSPCQYLDFLIQHYLVALWTIQLLSNIREDFLNVSSIVHLYLRKWFLYFAHRSPNAWTLSTLSLRSLGTWKRIVISVPLLRTWRWVFDYWFAFKLLHLISPPQAFLLSFFPELSSTRCSAFHLKEKGARKHREIHDVEQTKKTVPLITREITFSQHASELVLLCQHIWFGFWGPNWLCQICGFWTRVSLLDFCPLWSFWSPLQCLQWCTTEIRLEKKLRFDSWSSSRFLLFEGLELWCGDAVLFDGRFTSVTTSHKWRAGSPSIRTPASKDDFILTFVSCTSNLWGQMLHFRNA